MNPPSLLLTIVKSDSLFSREIKSCIVEDNMTKTIHKLEGDAKVLSMEDVLFILEQGEYKYWTWSHTMNVFLHYDLDELKAQVKDLGDEFLRDDHYQFSHKTRKVVSLLLTS